MKTLYTKQTINKILLSLFAIIVFVGITVPTAQAGSVCALGSGCTVTDAAITLAGSASIADGSSANFSVYAFVLNQYSSFMTAYLVFFTPDSGGPTDLYPSNIPPNGNGETLGGLSTGPLIYTQSGWITFCAYESQGNSLCAPQKRITVTAPPTVNLNFSAADKIKQFLKDIFSKTEEASHTKTS